MRDSRRVEKVEKQKNLAHMDRMSTLKSVGEVHVKDSTTSFLVQRENGQARKRARCCIREMLVAWIRAEDHVALLLQGMCRYDRSQSIRTRDGAVL